MRAIYIDSDYKCHTSNPDGEYREIETDFFDGKCETFVEGYRYIPDGENWTNENGIVFSGEMISPWKKYSILQAAQAEYEKAKAEMDDMRAALELLGVTPNE